MMAQGVKLQVGGGADGSGRNAHDFYVVQKNEVRGIIKLVNVWHAIGHRVSFFPLIFGALNLHWNIERRSYNFARLYMDKYAVWSFCEGCLRHGSIVKWHQCYP